MKFGFKNFGIFVMSGVLAVSGGAVSARGAAIQAGVNAVLSDCLNAASGAADGQKAPQASGSEKTGSKKKAEKKAKKQSADSRTVCGYKNLGIANVDNYLNIRSEPSENGKIVGKLPSDAGCEILGEEGGWYHITSGKVSGYVKGEFILKGKKAEKAASRLKKEIATVNTLTVYIREKPNTDCTILTIVTEDEELEIVEKGKEWIEVKLDDENGYVNAKYVDVSEELKKAMTFTETQQQEGVSDSRYALVQTALGYVGNRYVWGGSSLTGGVDCSGFTMQIMAKYGIYLPHSSAAQSGCGRSVSTAELLPGDLIFYGSGGSISHVAIYIGNGQIVHASNERDGIKVSNAFYRTPICCRRMF